MRGSNHKLGYLLWILGIGVVMFIANTILEFFNLI